MTATVQHRPASHGRAPRDSVVALDMFSGCGGSSQGIEAAGIDVWYAANHWQYAVELHEANHPKAEHFIADLLDTEAGDYYHPEMLPRADVLWASPTCTNHSKANSERAYRKNLSLFEVDDDDYEANVTASERSRATAVCVLQYARKHRPKVIVVENVVEFAAWGMQQGHTKKGDGSTFRWWLAEFDRLGYDQRVLYLNSQFFPPCPQSRDRMYVCFWDRSMRSPDLDFTPEAWCDYCETTVRARQTWKQRTAAWPTEQWGKYSDQYVYACPSCNRRVHPVAWPAATAIDWSDLGQRIGDRDTPLADTTMARIARGVEKFGQWPPFLMPAKSVYGSDASVADPLRTLTTQQERMVINAFQVVAAGNTHERDGSTCRTRGMDQPLWTQHTTAAFGLVAHPETFMVKNTGAIDEAKYRAYPTSEPFGSFVSTAITQGMVTMPVAIDNYQGAPRSPLEPLPTQAGSETMGLIAAPMIHTARGTDASHAAAKLDPVTAPLSSVVAGGNHHYLLSPLFAKQNGGPDDTAWHQVIADPLNTLLGRDTTCLLSPGDTEPISVEDCMYRMLTPDEIRTGMGIDPTFHMWGPARDRVRALGNAVTPPVSKWICERLLEVLR